MSSSDRFPVKPQGKTPSILRQVKARWLEVYALGDESSRNFGLNFESPDLAEFLFLAGFQQGSRE